MANKVITSVDETTSIDNTNSFFVNHENDIKQIKKSNVKLPNPNAITFTGAVSATYDGTEAVSINIPQAVTYTAGTGISIYGGVISVNIPNGDEVSY